VYFCHVSRRLADILRHLDNIFWQGHQYETVSGFVCASFGYIHRQWLARPGIRRWRRQRQWCLAAACTGRATLGGRTTSRASPSGRRWPQVGDEHVEKPLLPLLPNPLQLPEPFLLQRGDGAEHHLAFATLHPHHYLGEGNWSSEIHELLRWDGNDFECIDAGTFGHHLHVAWMLWMNVLNIWTPSLYVVMKLLYGQSIF